MNQRKLKICKYFLHDDELLFNRTFNGNCERTWEVYQDFEQSDYASGKYFEFISQEFEPKFEKVKRLFDHIDIPTAKDWKALQEQVQQHGFIIIDLQLHLHKVFHMYKMQQVQLCQLLIKLNVVLINANILSNAILVS